MFTKLFHSASVRRILATAIVAPAIMCAVVPPSWSQPSTSVQLLNNNAKKKKHHNVPESGVLATLGIALAVLVSAAVYRRRRVESL
ncbi:MAG TPA: hypothetical protein VJQ82_25860 [Terriglobales bacterium]|nr:hypothetical protein [Terriglobales bacterium]